MLLRKGVYPYEYMNTLERFNEKLLPKKGNFYSSLNMEDITDVHYRHTKKVFKIFNNKNVGVSWLVCSKLYIITFRCFWEF